MRVNICIPHFINENVKPSDNPNGYGSLREGATFNRTLAMGRCISSLLNLQRSGKTAQLNMAQRIDFWTNARSKLEIKITIVTDGHHRLDGLLEYFGSQVQVLDVELDDPRLLPLACRDHLIETGEGADLLAYLEDDLIINDPEFFDKQYWFLKKQAIVFALCHIDMNAVEVRNRQLLVDGPLTPSFIKNLQPQPNAAQGAYNGVEAVSFDITDNPHSGMFVISGSQATTLRNRKLPRSGFIGPLETAATLTVLQNFPVMKTSLKNWTFLRVEHGHPSFLHYFNKFPLSPLKAS